MLKSNLKQSDMTSLNIEDLEDQLDNFIIRKSKDSLRAYAAPRKELTNGQKICDHIPLLVSDLLQARPDQDDNTVYTVLRPATINFRTCLLYGFVAAHGVHNKSYYKFVIDDGTGSIEFNTYAKPKESVVIRSLHNEATTVRGICGTERLEKLSSGMMRLLENAMEYIDSSKISLGDNVLLYGRPNYFRNRISLDVISFGIDNKKSRKLELAFADNLIEYYRNLKSK